MSDNTLRPPRLAALRYRDFRLLWSGELISMVGSFMQTTAISWHIYELLRGQTYTLSVLGREIELGAEALGLGTLGLVRILPTILFALVGGVMADTRDRRLLMIWTQLAGSVLAGILALVTLSGNATVGVLYLLTAASGALRAFDEPARQSIIPQLVPREHLTNAVSLNTLLWQVGTIVGPATAGVMIARLEIGQVCLVNAGSYALPSNAHRAGATGFNRFTLLSNP